MSQRETNGFAVVRPLYGPAGIRGMSLEPVIAWRVDRNADSGRIVPVTDYDDEPPDDIYAIRHPDGSFHFPDGERCDNESALFARFRKRLEDLRGSASVF
jgi:hypothetical protein